MFSAVGQNSRLKQPPAQPWLSIGWRHAHAALVWSVVVICYADRSNIGIVLARQDFPGVPHHYKGSILSAFFVGYFCTQIPGGILAWRWGAKPTLLLAAATWTVFDALTPGLARFGFVPLYLGRVCMGLGEGLVFPTQAALANFWIPTCERGFLVTFMTSGQDFGSVLANLVSPVLLGHAVTLVFNFWACAALAWAAFFVLFGASAPEVHASCVKSGEAAWIQQHRDAPDLAEVRRLRAREPLFPLRLFREPSALAIIVAHSGVNYMWYIVISWLPSFFAEVFGLDLTGRSYILAVPYLSGFFGLLLAGLVSDAAVRRGFRTRHARKASQMIGATGVAVFLQFAAHAGSASWAGLWMALALFFGKMQNAGFWVNMVDICPETASTMMGLSNSIATIPGILGQPLTQEIMRQTGSWSVVYGVCGLVGMSTALVFLAFGDDVSLDGPPAVSEPAPDELARTVGAPAEACDARYS